MEIAYLDDRPDGEVQAVVLWLHGGFVSHRAWEPQRDYFQRSETARHWRHIYVDVPGHGASSRDRRRYDVEEFASDLLALLDALEITEVVCVGHSLGGMIAQTMARRAPERIIAMVLADTTYSTQSTLREGAQTLLARALFRALSIEKIAKMSARQLSTIRPDVGPFIYTEMMTHAADREAFLAMWRAVFEFDSRAWISLIECPVLLLVAQENKATRAQRAGFIRAIQDIEVVEIPRTGHMLGWDNPEAFNKAVEAFVERVCDECFAT